MDTIKQYINKTNGLLKLRQVVYQTATTAAAALWVRDYIVSHQVTVGSATIAVVVALVAGLFVGYAPVNIKK